MTMIVTHSTTDGSPDVFLRIEVGSGHRQVDQLQTWMGSEHIAYGLSTMPRCAIQEHNQGYIRHCIQDL